MKTFILILTLCGVLQAQAQSDKYVQAMKQKLVLFDSAKTTAELQAASAAFERIAEAEKTQWLPYYYAALAQARVGFNDKAADKEVLAAKADELLTKAEAIEKNADLWSVRNMIATIQMLVDPMTRWQTYGAKASAAIQEGLKLDPNNPRLYYLQGMSVYGTPAQFGGGKDKAKPIFEKAVAAGKAEQIKPLHPNWGLKESEKMLALCSQ